ncbi:hypothetical protein HK103_006201 [Boothiomyces macroporosus]|uniref:Uncharacterized protein n=1 Tax=Boothiomyces macroporosus TaxID=261099 RepID=A0AAD5Y799_9FUNG|nr:hypothetical protein HK103_006201 [Boothiomyces macroporosus]
MEKRLQLEFQTNQLISFHVSADLKVTLVFPHIVYDNIDFYLFKSSCQTEIILPYNLDIAIQLGYKIKEILKFVVTVYSDTEIPHTIDYEIKRFKILFYVKNDDYNYIVYLQLETEVKLLVVGERELGLVLGMYDHSLEEFQIMDRECTPSDCPSLTSEDCTPSKPGKNQEFTLVKSFNTLFDEYMMQGAEIVCKTKVS